MLLRVAATGERRAMAPNGEAGGLSSVAVVLVVVEVVGA